jgi:hypothetical protein
MGTGVGADRGTGSAARAREPFAATLFRRASALALIGMAAFTVIGMITRRRAGWPVRRVSMCSRITRQSPAYAPCDAFADVSAAAPAIASADTARRIRFITASFFSRKECQRPSARSSSGYYRNFKVPGTLRKQTRLFAVCLSNGSKRISKNLRSEPRASSRRGESSRGRCSNILRISRRAELLLQTCLPERCARRHVDVVDAASASAHFEHC